MGRKKNKNSNKNLGTIDKDKAEEFLKKFCHIDVIKFLVADDRHYETLRELFQLKYCKEKSFVKNSSLILIASYFKSSKNLALLLDQGFDVNATDEDGNNALHYTIVPKISSLLEEFLYAQNLKSLNFGENAGILKMLLKSNCKIVSNKNKISAAEFAALHNHRPTIKTLKDNKITIPNIVQKEKKLELLELLDKTKSLVSYINSHVTLNQYKDIKEIGMFVHCAQYPKVIQALTRQDYGLFNKAVSEVKDGIISIKSNSGNEMLQDKVACLYAFLVEINDFYTDSNLFQQDFIFKNLHITQESWQKILYLMIFEKLINLASRDQADYEKIYNDAIKFQQLNPSLSSKELIPFEYLQYVIAIYRLDQVCNQPNQKTSEPTLVQSITEEETLIYSNFVAVKASEVEESKDATIDYKNGDNEQFKSYETYEDHFIDQKKFAQFVALEKQKLIEIGFEDTSRIKSWKIKGETYSTEDPDIIQISCNNFFAYLDKDKLRKAHERLIKKSTSALYNGIIPSASTDRYGVKFMKAKGIYEIKVEGDDRISANTVYKNECGDYLIIFDLLFNHAKIDNLAESKINIENVENGNILPRMHFTTEEWEQKYIEKESKVSGDLSYSEMD